jgi:hypothetical protein
MNTNFLDKINPYVHFNVLTTGIIVSSERLRTTRFVAFDTPGQCRSCKSDHLQIDHCVTKDGILLFSNRFNAQKFIQFDIVERFPAYCYFSVKCRGRLYKIPHESIQEEQPVILKRQKMECEERQTPAPKTSPVFDSFVLESSKPKSKTLDSIIPTSHTASEHKDEEEAKKSAFIESLLTPTSKVNVRGEGTSSVFDSLIMESSKPTPKTINSIIPDTVSEPMGIEMAEPKKEEGEVKSAGQRFIESLTEASPKADKKEEEEEVDGKKEMMQ